MRVSFWLSTLELKTARNTFSKRVHSRARRALPWLNLAASLLMVIVSLLSGFHYFRQPHRSPDVFDIVIATLFLVSAAFQWRMRAKFAFDPDYAKEQTFELEEDGLFRGIEGAARVKVPWTKISRYVETDEFFLLASPWPWGIVKLERPTVLGRHDRPVLYIVPKRVLNSSDADRFRDLLQRRLSVWAKNPDLKKEAVLSV